MALTYAARKRLQRAAKPVGSKFSTGRFVAVDGEGFNHGEEIETHIGDRTYRGFQHSYALLRDSDGREIYADSGHIDGYSALEFFLDISRRDTSAIVVLFSGSYDICHILGTCVDRYDAKTLLRKSLNKTYLDIEGPNADYRLEYRPRKSLTIWRFASGADKYKHIQHRDGSRSWKLAPECKVTIWDVWGFFQGNYVGALKAWLPNDPRAAIIRENKAKRSQFQRSELETIRRYCAMELETLVDMMGLVRDAIRDLGLTVQRWDGAGSIAAAFFKRHNVKQHMGELPPDVRAAAEIAYSGGHIEACKIGFHNDTIWHYDVASAYPAQFRRLPDMVSGTWKTGDGEPPAGFTLVKLHFHFLPGLPFYPLFHRSANGTILYPERGSGWYWYDEYRSASDFAKVHGSFIFRVVSWFYYDVRTNASPFHWIEDAYDLRQKIVAETKRTGVPNGAEKMIKLGINSCYGKTAQQSGARWDQGALVEPPYFNIAWAGFVTSGCRAQLMQAAMRDPTAIISFATDGLFATRDLGLPVTTTKQLGAWELETHAGMLLVMPGVYWLFDQARPPTHYSRGFDKDQMEHGADAIMAAWRRGETAVRMRQRCMITLGAATVSDAMWDQRGRFLTVDRTLDLTGDNSKRDGINVKRRRPHKQLCDTHPRSLTEDYSVGFDAIMSAPFELKWNRLMDAEDVPSEDISAFTSFSVLPGEHVSTGFFRN